MLTVLEDVFVDFKVQLIGANIVFKLLPSHVSTGGGPLEVKPAGGGPLEVKLSGVGLFGGSVVSVERFAEARGQGLAQGPGLGQGPGLAQGAGIAQRQRLLPGAGTEGTLVVSRQKPTHNIISNNNNISTSSNNNNSSNKKTTVITKYPLAQCREITRQVSAHYSSILYLNHSYIISKSYCFFLKQFERLDEILCPLFTLIPRLTLTST